MKSYLPTTSLNSSVKLEVLKLLDRSDTSCIFPQVPRKSALPVDIKEKVPKGTLKGVAEHVKISSETCNDLETDFVTLCSIPTALCSLLTNLSCLHTFHRLSNAFVTVKRVETKCVL
jgi:hypothetical protein